MSAYALSASLFGLDAQIVHVEVEAARGVPSFELSGLAEAAVREARVRVRTALSGVGVNLSEYRIVVNFAPADVRKHGSGFDLAIAAAILAALGGGSREAIGSALFVGELGLSGHVHGVRGVLPQLLAARRYGARCAIVPRANEAEAALVRGLDVRTVATLAELVGWAKNGRELPVATASAAEPPPALVEDLADVRGQLSARRALEIAAAGGHNLLFIGPPGAGKTMLARRLPGLLPSMAFEEALEVTAIHSVAGVLGRARHLLAARPFRAPHHTVSEAALVGGTDGARPGEVSLAHHGVLFLDELGEFHRRALESLRQPLEDGVVTISRAHRKATYPARPLLVAAMNPCPCGYRGERGRCVCPDDRVRLYRSRLSGPLLDRIDLHISVPPVAVTALHRTELGESTATVRARVERARAVQRARFEAGEVARAADASLLPRDADRVAVPCDEGARLLSRAVSRLGLSARAYGKVLRVARTIADLEGSTAIRPPHVAEAVGLRVLDREPMPIACGAA